MTAADHAARLTRITDRLALAVDEAETSGRSYTKRRQAVTRMRLELEELRDLTRAIADGDPGV